MGQLIDKQSIPPQQSQTLVIHTLGPLQLNFTDSHLMMMGRLFSSMKQGIARQSEMMDDGQEQTFERKIESQEGPNNLNCLQFIFQVFKKQKYYFYLRSTFSVEDPLQKRVVHVETIQFDSTKQIQSIQGQRIMVPLSLLQQIDLFFQEMINDVICQKNPIPPFSQQFIQQQNPNQLQYQFPPQLQLPLQQTLPQQQFQLIQSQPILQIPPQPNVRHLPQQLQQNQPVFGQVAQPFYYHQ